MSELNVEVQETQEAPVSEEAGVQVEEQVVSEEVGSVDQGGETPVSQEPQQEEVEVEVKPEIKNYDFSAPLVDHVSKLVSDAGLVPAEVTKLVMGSDTIPQSILLKLAEKHGEGVASMVGAQLSQMKEAAQYKIAQEEKARIKAAKENDAKVYGIVEEAFKDITTQSGKETWKELAGWAKTNVPKEEVVELNEMLQRGGLSAKYATQELISRFKNRDDYTQPSIKESADSASSSKSRSPLSSTEYNNQLNELLRSGHNYNSSAVQALQARRTAGMKRGI